MTVTTATVTCAIRGEAYAAVARALSDPVTLSDRDALASLRTCLERCGVPEAAALVGSISASGDVDEAARMHNHLFSRGKVAPYEASYVGGGIAGLTAQLADVSGFYSAFGISVTDERPDHCVAELEFAAYVSLAEAHMHEAGEVDGAQTCAAAYEAFLGDHLGGWLGAYADALRKAFPDSPYGPVVSAAAMLVEFEVERLGVTTRSPGPALPGWAHLSADGFDDEELPDCGSCPQAQDEVPPIVGE